MQLDTGTTVILIAALIFYLRLIIIQRQRAKRYPQRSQAAQKKHKRKGSTKKAAAPEPSFMEKYSILSTNRNDWIIAGAGVLAIVLGVLLYAGAFGQGGVQAYWWAPTALGIIAFSWGFR